MQCLDWCEIRTSCTQLRTNKNTKTKRGRYKLVSVSGFFLYSLQRNIPDSHYILFFFFSRSVRKYFIYGYQNQSKPTRLWPCMIQPISAFSLGVDSALRFEKERKFSFFRAEKMYNKYDNKCIINIHFNKSTTKWSERRRKNPEIKCMNAISQVNERKKYAFGATWKFSDFIELICHYHHTLLISLEKN